MTNLATDLFATVAVDQPLDALYTYLLPERFHHATPGTRVLVPLGRGNRLTPATILDISATPPGFAGAHTDQVVEEGSLFEAQRVEPGIEGVKAVADLITEAAIIPQDLLDLAKWIAAYYVAPIGMTLATMVPAAVKRGTRIPSNAKIALVSPEKSLEDTLAEIKISPRARKVFTHAFDLLQSGPLLEPEFLTTLGIGRVMLKRLAGLNLLRIDRELKLPDAGIIGADLPAPAPLTLSADQTAALENIHALTDSHKFGVRLIHGVTGSGKTELYIRAIERVVAAGKRAIVLVPEISLTPQTVKRFTQRFPRVAVLHSGMKDAERHQHWHAIASGWAQVVVGARSAIFAPAADIGLIVVDEEHDASYKQDNLPKYHGRDVAIRRAQMLNIPILLGSATPSLESWHNATAPPIAPGLPGVTAPPETGAHKHWSLLSLRQRPLNTAMPRVVVVDMKHQHKERRGLHILSTVLEHHLKQTLAAKKQAIFLLNRRGYAHYVMCPRCDWVMMCENCDATMVVHRTRTEEKGLRTEPANPKTQSSVLSPRHSLKGNVQCHYCLTSTLLPDRCPLCQALLTHLGQGTQRAEDELLRKFPDLRLKRMDSDSMQNAGHYQATLDAFGNGEIDLLIGTQMIAKGLDFPNVSLVGVLNADLAMTIPDFRAAERTFQLVCQVAGRSGRAMGGSDRGTVIVQTFQPEEPAIAAACNHDYLAFVGIELPHRKEWRYPPYGRLARIVLSHKDHGKTTAVAESVGRLLTATIEKLGPQAGGIRVQGPLAPPMERLIEMYRSEILLFGPTAASLQRLLTTLRNRGLLQQSAWGGVTLSVDIDPVHML